MQDWLSWFWLPFGLSLGFAALFYLTEYNARDDRKKRKLLYVEIVYCFGIVTYGALALGQTWTFRNDGIKIEWGRWALFAASQWAVIATVCISMTPSKTLRWQGILMATIQSLCVLFMILSSSQFVPHHGPGWQALVFFTSMAAIFTVGLYFFMFSLAMNWWKRWVEQEAATVKDRTTFSSGKGVMSRWSQAALATAVFITTCMYPILAAVGPEGFRVSTDYELSMFLVMFLCDILTKFVLLPIVYVVFNPDGVNPTSYFQIFESASSNPAAAEGEPKSELFSASQIGAAVAATYYPGDTTRVRFAPAADTEYKAPMLHKRRHYSPAEVDAMAVRANPNLRPIQMQSFNEDDATF